MCGYKVNIYFSLPPSSSSCMLGQTKSHTRTATAAAPAVPALAILMLQWSTRSDNRLKFMFRSCMCGILIYISLGDTFDTILFSFLCFCYMHVIIIILFGWFIYWYWFDIVNWKLALLIIRSLILFNSCCCSWLSDVKWIFSGGLAFEHTYKTRRRLDHVWFWRQIKYSTKYSLKSNWYICCSPKTQGYITIHMGSMHQISKTGCYGDTIDIN